MDDLIAILEGLSRVIWPIIVLYIAIKYSHPISGFIHSLAKRKMTVKIGDKRITVDEANAQQLDLIAELHKEILEIKNIISIQGPERTKNAALNLTKQQAKTILWIDDQAHKHAYIIELIKSLGFKVFVYVTSKEALQFLNNHTPDFLISDLGRLENEGYDSLAGIHLAQEAKKIKPEVPFYIFSKAASMINRDVEKGLITLATSSYSELVEHLVFESTIQSKHKEVLKQVR